MKNKSNKIIYSIIILVIVVFASVWYVIGRNQNNENDLNQEEPEQFNQEDIKDLQLEGAIYTAKTSQNETIIHKFNLDTSEEKVVFSDQKEKEKIKSLAGIINDKYILAQFMVTGQEFIGSLYKVSLDASAKKEEIAQDFASSQPPKASPDGKKIAYTMFSNAEFDFGFKLIIANIDNTSMTEIDSDKSNITIYSWDPNSKKICYKKGNDEDSTKLYYADVSSGKISNLAEIKGRVHDLFWGNEDLFVSSIQEKGKSLNQTELFKFSLNNIKLDQITKNDKFESSVVVSPDLKGISYFSTTFEGEEKTAMKDGEIFISQISGENVKKINDGNIVLGWMQ